MNENWSEELIKHIENEVTERVVSRMSPQEIIDFYKKVRGLSIIIEEDVEEKYPKIILVGNEVRLYHTNSLYNSIDLEPWLNTKLNEDQTESEVVTDWGCIHTPPTLESQPTKLSDLVGEDGQTRAYLIPNTKIGVKWGREFSPKWNGDEWCDIKSKRPSLENHFRWSHSPSTEFEDANEFVFEKESKKDFKEEFNKMIDRRKRGSLLKSSTRFWSNHE